MTKIEMIINVLSDHPCLNSKEISSFVFRKYGEHISAQSASGSLRPLVSRGQIGKDDHTGKMVYWLTDYGKETLIK